MFCNIEVFSNKFNLLFAFVWTNKTDFCIGAQPIFINFKVNPSRAVFFFRNIKHYYSPDAIPSFCSFIFISSNLYFKTSFLPFSVISTTSIPPFLYFFTYFLFVIYPLLFLLFPFLFCLPHQTFYKSWVVVVMQEKKQEMLFQQVLLKYFSLFLHFYISSYILLNELYHFKYESPPYSAIVE